MKILIYNINPNDYMGQAVKYLNSRNQSENSPDFSEILIINDTNGDIIFNPVTENFSDIEAKLPPGWKTDVLIFWGPEYTLIPQGFENTPFPIVAMLGDWNLSFSNLRDNIKQFDFIVSDKSCVETLKKAGYKNVDYWPGNAFNPDFHKRLPNVEKIYDVVFIGSINNDIHRKREKWLYRLTSMADKYKINILLNVYGDKYVETLNQSKIVFNYGIRKEINMRAFEAPACGALLFLEEDNLEVRDYFEPGKECILYNNDNFEEILAYYIAHDQEREEIIKASEERVKTESYRHHLERLLKLIKENGIIGLKKFSRPFCNLPQSEKLYQNGLSALYAVGNKSILAAKRLFEESLKLNSDSSETWNACGLAYANDALEPDNIQIKNTVLRKAMRMFGKAISLNPLSVIAYYNQGNISLALNQPEAAKEKFLKVIDLLESGTENIFDCKTLLFPREFNLFRIEWENITAAFIDSENSLFREYKNLLSWKVSEKMGDYFLKNNHFEQAQSFYLKSILARPELASQSRWKLAEILKNQGNNEDAYQQYQKAINDEPFNKLIWLDIIDFLFNINWYSECEQFCRKFLLLSSVSPLYEIDTSDIYTSLIFEIRLNEIQKEKIDNIMSICQTNMKYN